MGLQLNTNKLSLLVLIVILALAMPSSAELVDRVVAVVNNDVITSTEIQKSWEPIRRLIHERATGEIPEETLVAEKKKVLESQIDNLLISQEAATMKISVSEAEIDEAVGRIAENNKITVEELHKELERTGIDLKDYRKDIYNNIQRSKLLGRKINSKIVISDEKAKEYYEKVFTSQNTKAGYHILQIGFTWGTKESAASSEEEAKQRALKLRKLVEEGQDFRELAKSFSELPSAEDGGNLGFFMENEMSENMRKILISLEPGQASEVIKMSDSYQFYMLLSVNTDGTTRFAPLKVFKSEIFDTLYNNEQKKRYENWLQEIRERSYIKILL